MTFCTHIANIATSINRCIISYTFILSLTGITMVAVRELWMITIVLFVCSVSSDTSIQKISEFLLPSGCTCPGDQLVFECSVQGGVATVWQGSIFDCGHGVHSIRLRHSKFNLQQSARGECNNRLSQPIVAQSIGVFNGTYISQLNVTVTEAMNNMTVECTAEYVNAITSIISISTVIVATGKSVVKL